MKQSRKTVRFSVIVKKCGKSEAVTPWGKPDQQFKMAMEKHHVITVHLRHGAKDYGEVGFHPGKNTSYFVFPKSLAKYENACIVGINYDLLAGAEARGVPAPTKPEKKAAPAPKPAVRRFKVTARVTATVDIESAVDAPNRAAAEQAARAKIAKQQIDFSVGRLVNKNLRAVPERP